VLSLRPNAKLDKEACLVLIDQEQFKEKKVALNNTKIKDALRQISQLNSFTAENGQIFPISHNKTLILLVGLGKRSDLSLTSLRIAVRNALLSSYLKKVRDVEIVAHEQTESTLKAIIEGHLIGTYQWAKYKSKDKNDQSIVEKNVYLVASQRKSLEDAITICAGVNLARDLINDNADTVDSKHLEATIRTLIKGKKHISIEVLNEKELKAKGLGLHLAVNRGSLKEPKLIIVKYEGSSKKGDYTAMIGKGITFDTGGLNLKPTGHIETMRCDMSGAAAVIGTLKNVLALNVKRNLIFAVTIAENAIGSGAFKPGDVFKSYNGKTVEIGNTDAEGRLVLADAISYIVRNYKPGRIIDLATLTGACVVALGNDYAGLVVSDDKFSRDIVHSSNETDDRVWRLPSYPELKDSIKSLCADMKNVGFPKGAAGALTAAEFLRQFTEGTAWAHLDIAGTAFVDGSGRWYYGHGATGFGVRLLSHYLTNP